MKNRLSHEAFRKRPWSYPIFNSLIYNFKLSFAKNQSTLRDR